MKILTLIVLCAILVSGCGEKSKEGSVEDQTNVYAYDTTDLKTTELETENQVFSFKYQFKSDEKYRYRITTISEDQQSIKTDTTIEQSIRQTVIYLFNFEQAAAESDGTMELNCKISSIKLNASSGDQQIAYESGAGKDSAERTKYAEYEAMVNNPFSIRISVSGEILEIFRVDKMVNEYLKIRGYLDSLSAQEKSMVRSDLIEGVLKPLAVQIFRQMPSKEIEMDSSWSLSQPPSQFMVFQVSNTNIYTLAALEEFQKDTLAKFQAKLDTKITGERKLSDRGINYEFDTPVTSGEGTIYFNISEGLIQKSRTGTTINVFYKMEANTPQGKQTGSRKEKIRNTNIVERI